MYMIINVIGSTTKAQTPTVTPAVISVVHSWLQKGFPNIIIWSYIVCIFLYGHDMQFLQDKL